MSMYKFYVTMGILTLMFIHTITSCETLKEDKQKLLVEYKYRIYYHWSVNYSWEDTNHYEIVDGWIVFFNHRDKYVRINQSNVYIIIDNLIHENNNQKQ